MLVDKRLNFINCRKICNTMNIEEIRDYCLKKRGVTEGFPFGDDTIVFKAGGKMFLLANLEGPLSLNIKATPGDVADRIEHYSEVKPGYHMNKKHWITVEVENCTDDLRLQSWIDESYNLIVNNLPAKTKNELM